MSQKVSVYSVFLKHLSASKHSLMASFVVGFKMKRQICAQTRANLFVAIKVHSCLCYKCCGTVSSPVISHGSVNKHTVITKQLRGHYRHPAERSQDGISGPRHTHCRSFNLVHKNWSRRLGMMFSECNCLQITYYC